MGRNDAAGVNCHFGYKQLLAAQQIPSVKDYLLLVVKMLI
jgi:hypothetical protein